MVTSGLASASSTPTAGGVASAGYGFPGGSNLGVSIGACAATAVAVRRCSSTAAGYYEGGFGGIVHDKATTSSTVLVSVLCVACAHLADQNPEYIALGEIELALQGGACSPCIAVRVGLAGCTSS